jgi:hypothetical protein
MLAAFRSRALALLTLPTLLAACHSYVPVITAPGPGTRLSAELTDTGTSELARYVGPRVAVIEGGLVSASDSAVTLSVILTRQHNGVDSYWTGEQVTVPRPYIAHLTERRLARGRTAVATGGFTALLAALALAFSGGFNGGGNPRDPGTGTR